jgi:hypothetical protein
MTVLNIRAAFASTFTLMEDLLNKLFAVNTSSFARVQFPAVYKIKIYYIRKQYRAAVTEDRQLYMYVMRGNVWAAYSRLGGMVIRDFVAARKRM